MNNISYIDNLVHRKLVESKIKQLTENRKPKHFSFSELVDDKDLNLSEREIGEVLKCLCRDVFLTVRNLEYYVLR